MKILKLQAENIKKLVAVEITPAGDTVIISGDNGAGKSSVLDAIFWALAGAKNIQDKPIRDGQDKAFIRLDLGKYTVERRFTQKGTYLDVRTVEGAKFTDAQAVLNDLIGSIAFDPLEFARMKPADQYDVIRGIVDLGVDLDKLKKSYDEDFAERRDINRDIKSLEAQIASIVLPEVVPEAEVNIVELSRQLMSYNKANENHSASIRDGNRIIEELDAAHQELIHAQNKVEQLKKSLDEAVDRSRKLDAEKPTQEQVEALQKQIETANQVNADYQKVVRKEELEVKLISEKSKAESLTMKLEGYIKQKEDAFAAAKWPVPGLTLRDGAVYYNGIPFDQASSAEQLRVSAAIAMSGNSELRVMRIKDGSLLDPNGFKILKEMAKEHDYQVWIESVYTNDPMAIIIEDGSVKGATNKAEKITEEEFKKLQKDAAND